MALVRSLASSNAWRACVSGKAHLTKQFVYSQRSKKGFKLIIANYKDYFTEKARNDNLININKYTLSKLFLLSKQF